VRLAVPENVAQFAVGTSRGWLLRLGAANQDHERTSPDLGSAKIFYLPMQRR